MTKDNNTKPEKITVTSAEAKEIKGKNKGDEVTIGKDKDKYELTENATNFFRVSAKAKSSAKNKDVVINGPWNAAFWLVTIGLPVILLGGGGGYYYWKKRQDKKEEIDSL